MTIRFPIVKTFCVSLVFSYLSLMGQTISGGIKGGANLTDPAERFDQSQRYTVGAVLEIGFTSKLALEANALYNRFGTSYPLQGLSGRTRGHAWEFPLLGKYYFADRRAAVRPFVSSGFTFRNIWFDNDDGRSRAGRISTDPAVGAVVAGGVSLKAWRVQVAPEFRYTRWGGSNFPATNLNHAQVLLGIQF
jgi:outer membrane protein W